MREGEKEMRIFTSRYSFKIPQEFQAVSISVGKPKWQLPYSLEIYDKLAPYGVFNKYNDEEPYKKAYFERLDKYGVAQIRKDLEQISNKNGGKDVVLLCYENLSKPELWCHRTHFAEWWFEQTGEIIQELEDYLKGEEPKIKKCNHHHEEEGKKKEDDGIPEAVKARMKSMEEDEIRLF